MIEWWSDEAALRARCHPGLWYSLINESLHAVSAAESRRRKFLLSMRERPGSIERRLRPHRRPFPVARTRTCGVISSVRTRTAIWSSSRSSALRQSLDSRSRGTGRPSCIVSFLWFLYRKMYLYAAVYAIGPMVSTYLTGDMTSGIVWSVVAGATANYVYYWHCREHIAAIKQQAWNDPIQQHAAIEGRGRRATVRHLGRGRVLSALLADDVQNASRRRPGCRQGSEETGQDGWQCRRR